MNKSLFFLFTVSFLFSRITNSMEDEFDDDGLNFHSGPKVIDKDMKGSVDVEYTIEKQNQIIWNQEMEDEKKDLILPNFTIYVKTNFEEEELPVETNFEEEDSEEVEDYTLKLPRGEEEVEDYTLKLPRGEEEEENTNEDTPSPAQQRVETDNEANNQKAKYTLNTKTIYVECGESRFGCCYDGITLKIDHFGTNCFSDTYNIDIRDTPLLRTNEESPNRFRRPP